MREFRVTDRPGAPLIDHVMNLAPSDALTRRELDILIALSRGATYDEAAARLGISINTVRTHVRALYDKLQVRTKTEAVVVGLETGLIRSRV